MCEPHAGRLNAETGSKYDSGRLPSAELRTRTEGPTSAGSRPPIKDAPAQKSLIREARQQSSVEKARRSSGAWWQFSLKYGGTAGTELSCCQVVSVSGAPPGQEPYSLIMKKPKFSSSSSSSHGEPDGRDRLVALRPMIEPKASPAGRKCGGHWIWISGAFNVNT